MTYITFKRFKNIGISGEFNIPAAVELDCVDGFISYNGYPICSVKSQNAYDYFARNDDNRGLQRGKLTQAIVKQLSKRDNLYQKKMG